MFNILLISLFVNGYLAAPGNITGVDLDIKGISDTLHDLSNQMADIQRACSPGPIDDGGRNSDGSAECGVPSDVVLSAGEQENYVIGGSTSKRGAWPWQALLIYQGRPVCGASIVNERWIVTAAHCLHGGKRDDKQLSVRVGDHDRYREEGSEVTIPARRTIVHPEFNSPTRINNDCALIELRKPITFTEYVKPVCLPSRDTQVGDRCVVTGWGKTKHPGKMVGKLQQAYLPIVTNQECSEYQDYMRVPITPAMLCAGDRGDSDKSGCHGDSGGPLVCSVAGKWELHGAVSWGSPDCNSNSSFSVFSRMFYFKGWILQNMNAEGS